MAGGSVRKGSSGGEDSSTRPASTGRDGCSPLPSGARDTAATVATGEYGDGSCRVVPTPSSAARWHETSTARHSSPISMRRETLTIAWPHIRPSAQSREHAGVPRRCRSCLSCFFVACWSVGGGACPVRTSACCRNRFVRQRPAANEDLAMLRRNAVWGRETALAFLGSSNYSK